jgi:hypothetical protein
MRIWNISEDGYSRSRHRSPYTVTHTHTHTQKQLEAKHVKTKADDEAKAPVTYASDTMIRISH